MASTSERAPRSKRRWRSGERSANQRSIATSLQRLGETALHQAHIDEAEPLYLEMLPLSRDLGADDDVAIGLGGLAAVAVGRGDLVRAAVLAGAEGAIRERVEETRDEFRVEAAERFYLQPRQGRAL